MSILADALSIPTPTHPSWCDPAFCTTVLDVSDELVVSHRVVVFDEPLALNRMAVEIVACDIVAIRDGSRVAGDPAGVRVNAGDVFEEMTPEQAGQLAAAVARAAELAGGAR